MTEGPLAFHDNEVEGRIHLWLDEYGGDTRVYVGLFSGVVKISVTEVCNHLGIRTAVYR